ncbi:bifunctional riboflavin kinase/FAD synthetase [Thermosulfurimonas dismutans]|uniref:Riboflavin biosynthesis protein n=1 Tax=Thermosulfurimonas dismutans TaxID=999894 RepID=A0A179D476_9BACT|nr:bifunctional riboflavin kinase/FAD synthetase [Thermosulfurimonas dismutans]OAQ20428.1 Riboflavin kinase [Thermosulfurimonas dismutans]
MEIYSPEDLPLELPSPVVTLGNFDGVHLGHQVLLSESLRLAHELQGTPMVVTFEPHPRKVLRPQASLKLLTTFEERLALIREFGLKAVLVIPFSKALAELPAEEFVEEYLLYGLKIKGLVVGFNYRFGKGREGDTELLKTMGEKYGFRVRVVPPKEVDGFTVSSSLIRELLCRGEVQKASRLLGRPYRLSGRVVKGHGRGRKLGFPTANLEVPPEKLIPARGVYAVKVKVNDRSFNGVMNIGLKPTFDERDLSLEVFIFEFQEDIYGQNLSVEFIRYLRPEKKFSSPAALKTQIEIDCKLAKDVLTS